MMGVTDFPLTTIATMTSEQCGLIAFVLILTESNKRCYSEKIVNFSPSAISCLLALHSLSLKQGFLYYFVMKNLGFYASISLSLWKQPAGVLLICFFFCWKVCKYTFWSLAKEWISTINSETSSTILNFLS